jgi:hypothetical protein
MTAALAAEDTMKKTLACMTTAVAVASSACGLANDNALLRAVPQRGTVSMNVPASQGQALSLGETSPFYQSTVSISTSVNGGIAGVYNVIEAITALPPTSTDNATVAVWGPSQPRGLERNSFRLTVTKVSDGVYAYVLAARPKASVDEEDFVAIVDGTAQPNDDSDGSGSLNVHWGALRSLDDSECMIGELRSTYDAASEPRALAVTFVEAQDGCRDQGPPTSAEYLYTETTAGTGTLDYAQQKDIHTRNDNKPLDETFEVHSQWNATGAGRSDVRISGGEVTPDLAALLPSSGATGVDVVECWDASFALVYANTTPAELSPLFNEPAGDAASCAFASP